MRPNSVKRKLAAGRTVVGPFMMIPAPSIAEMIGLAGFDFMVLDMEHGFPGLETVVNMARGADLHGCTPIVRVADMSRRNILQSMELGTGGILCPQIRKPEEVAEVVRQAKYSPVGSRGLAFTTRSGNYGTYEGNYFEDANREALVAIQIETREALDCVEEIVQVDGLDLVFVGPYDLSDALGHRGEIDHPEVVKAIEHTFEVTGAAGLWRGIFTGTPEASHKWAKRGVELLAMGIDVSYLQQGLRTAADAVADIRA